MLISPFLIMSASFKFVIIRQYLTDEVAILVANALVSSRLDYCNSLFRSLSSLNMHKLQFLEVPQFCTLIQKNTMAIALLLMLPQSGMICLMRSVLSQLSRLFQKRVNIISLQKGIPNLAYTLSGVSVVLDLATAIDR